MIEVKNLSVTVQDKHILKDVSVLFQKDTMNCIFGESGSGKSTLLKALPNLIEYTGIIELGGVNTRDINPVELRKKIAYVSQSPIINLPTVKDNLLLPFTFKSNKLPIPTDKELGDMLENFLIPRDFLNEDASRLSGGEKQRVHIARAILQKPSWLLLDEPTSALDVKAQGIAFEYLKSLKKQTGIIIVTHSVDIIVECDMKIHIDKGEIVKIWYEELSSDLIKSVIRNNLEA